MTGDHEISFDLWRAGDALRDVIEPQIRGECLRALFFLKYVSDVERDRVENTTPRFFVPRDASFDALVPLCGTPGNAARVGAALLELERANPEKLRRLFSDLKWGPSESPESDAFDKALGSAIKILGSPKFDLRPSRLREHQVAEAFELIMATFPAVSSYPGELYTPTEVSNLMAQLVDPHPGDSIYDPVCGSAGLLITCAGLLQERYNSREYAIRGQEINPWAWRLAKLNAFMHGEDTHRIECGDTLRNPLHVQGNALEQFDVIVANPPFSLPYQEWEEAMTHDRFARFNRGRPPRGRADYAFILHMIASMRPEKGRIVTVAPHGVLFRGGGEADIRRSLIESNLLDAVIGLPAKLFYATAIPTAVLCFRAKREDDRVLFIDASRGFAADRKRNELRREDIERIVTTLRQRVSVPGYASIVPRKQIADNGFTLNISRYVSPNREEPRVDLQTLAQRQTELGKELEVTRDGIEALLQKLAPECLTEGSASGGE
jgi:type I restriction enzyme M protein